MALHSVETRLATAWPPAAWEDVTVLLAVSGGADSVALLRAMTALKTAGQGRLAVVHVNHQLRPTEAVADEALVVETCQRLGVCCEVQRVSIGSASGHRGQGPEAMARRARYATLQQVAARLGARYVVTAHTADDQAETILHRILRGTGIRGLAGMARTRPLGPATLLRPMLGIGRSEIRAYLEDLAQPYRHDSSNLDPRFTRNRIRNELLPRLAAQFNAGVVDALLRLGTLAGETQTIIDRLVDELIERCVRSGDSPAVRIERLPLAGQPPYLLRELLMTVWRRQGWPMQAMGFDQWDLLSGMVSPEGGGRSDALRKQMFSGSILVESTQQELLLQRAGS